jgi:hypothetical protein
VIAVVPGLLAAFAGIVLSAAALLPWAHHGPGFHLALGLCLAGSDCSQGVPGPPQYFLLLVGLALAGAGAWAVVRPPAAGRGTLAIACVVLLVLVYDVWSIQRGFSLLGMEVRDVAFYLAPVGVGLFGLSLLAAAAPRRSYPVLALVLVVLVLGSVTETNLFTTRPIGSCPSRSVGSGTSIC